MDLIEAAADRAAALEAHLAVELAKPVLSRRSVEIASEVRLEVNIAKMVAQLVPDPAAVIPKSAQHQRAAHSRWHHG